MLHLLAAGALGGIVPQANIADDTPAPAPPCEVLVLTFYNPCKCDWDKFHAFMSGTLTQPAATDVNGTTHAFDAQAAAGSKFTTKQFCLYEGCHHFEISDGAPADMSWLLSRRCARRRSNSRAVDTPLLLASMGARPARASQEGRDAIALGRGPLPRPLLLRDAPPAAGDAAVAAHARRAGGSGGSEGGGSGGGGGGGKETPAGICTSAQQKRVHRLVNRASLPRHHFRDGRRDRVPVLVDANALPVLARQLPGGGTAQQRLLPQPFGRRERAVVRHRGRDKLPSHLRRPLLVD